MWAFLPTSWWAFLLYMPGTPAIRLERMTQTTIDRTARRGMATAVVVALLGVAAGIVPLAVAAAGAAPRVAPIAGITGERISCPSPSTCYALAMTGTAGDLMNEQAEILATTDGGSSWRVENFTYAFGPYGASYWDITCPTTSSCYVELSGLGTSTSYATDLVATADGGQTWRTLTSPLPIGSPPYGLSCPGPLTCELASGGPNVYLTTDGGATWTAGTVATTNPITDVSCLTTRYCYATDGYTLFATSDGQTWGRVTAVPTEVPMDGVSCATTLICVTDAGALAPAPPHVDAARNTGSSWLVLAAALPAQTTALTDVTCPAATVCFAVGAVGSVPEVFRSMNGGASWAAEPLPAGVTARGISCPTPSLCFAAGSASGAAVAVFTTDGGATWTKQPFSSLPTGIAPPPPPVAPVVGLVAADAGYWKVRSDGTVESYGPAGNPGDMAGHPLNAPIVGMAPTATGRGYWLLGADGGVFSFGDAQFYGSTGSIHLNAPVVAMVATPSGSGYWFVASDGGVFAYGDARFYGSMGGRHLNQPVVGMAARDSGGYYLVARDGGVFTFGDAGFDGSTGNLVLRQPIVGMSVGAVGNGFDGVGGYWLVAADGGVFAFHAPFFGSADTGRPAAPVVGMIGGITGYLLGTADGSVFCFGNVGGGGLHVADLCGWPRS